MAANAQLMEKYGTAWVKEADVPIAAQLAAAILGGSLMASDSAHVAEQQAEAEALNEAGRQYEAARMSQTIGALDYKYAEAELSKLVKRAAVATASSMDKVAFGALLTRAVGAARKGIGGAASAAPRFRIQSLGSPAAAPGFFQ